LMDGIILYSIGKEISVDIRCKVSTE